MQNSKGYLLGKLFAQLVAEGALNPYTTYQVASTNPTAVIVPAFARLAETGNIDSITEVMNELPADALDNSVLSPADQADFPLGYYHERARLHRAEEQPDPEEAFTDQLLIRIEPSLKTWVLEQGGSKFVRSLLRTKRAERS